MKKLTNYLFLVILFFIFNGCSKKRLANEEDISQNEKELILETEHCRYYCISSNALGNCKIVVCECDKGYSCSSSTSY